MAWHRANHVNIAYTLTKEDASKALAIKAALFHDLG